MAKMRLSPIEKNKFSQQAYEILLQQIISQQFKHGQKLQVDDLAQQLGISRTPVKEALNLLAAEGLVELVPHIGTFVKSFSDQEIAEIYDIRRALEVLAAETLLDHLLPRDLAKLEALLRSMDTAFIKGTDLQTHSRKNHDFHSALIELSGNRKLVKTYESLHVSVWATQVSTAQETWKESFEAETAEHRSILEALQARDRKGLIDAVAIHLERSKQRLIENMKLRERREDERQGASLRPIKQARPLREAGSSLS